MKYTCACMIERKNYCPKGKGANGTLGHRLHLVPGHGAHVRYSLGTNVNTPFLQVPAPEFGHGAGARVQGLDLVLGHKKWAPGPCAHTTREFCKFRAVHCFVVAAKLMF